MIKLCLHYCRALLATSIDRAAFARMFWGVCASTLLLWLFVVATPVPSSAGLRAWADSPPMIMQIAQTGGNGGNSGGNGCTQTSNTKWFDPNTPGGPLSAIAATWLGPAKNIATRMLQALFVFEIFMIGLQAILFHGDIGQLFSSFAFKTFVACFFIYLIAHADTIFPAILNSFQLAGQQIGSGNASLFAIFTQGTNDASIFFCAAMAAHIADYVNGQQCGKFIAGTGDGGCAVTASVGHITFEFIAQGLGLVVIGSLGLMFLSLALIMAEAYIAIFAGAMFLGFSVTRFTMPFTQGFLTYMVNVGVKIFTFWIVVAIEQTLLLPMLQSAGIELLNGSNIQFGTGAEMLIVPAAVSVAQIAAMAALTWILPTTAGNFLTGESGVSAASIMSNISSALNNASNLIAAGAGSSGRTAVLAGAPASNAGRLPPPEVGRVMAVAEDMAPTQAPLEALLPLVASGVSPTTLSVNSSSAPSQHVTLNVNNTTQISTHTTVTSTTSTSDTESLDGSGELLPSENLGASENFSVNALGPRMRPGTSAESFAVVSPLRLHPEGEAHHDLPGASTDTGVPHSLPRGTRKAAQELDLEMNEQIETTETWSNVSASRRETIGDGETLDPAKIAFGGDVTASGASPDAQIGNTVSHTKAQSANPATAGSAATQNPATRTASTQPQTEPEAVSTWKAGTPSADEDSAEQVALQEDRSYEVMGGSSASFSARQAEPQTVAAASTGSASSSATTTGSSARSASTSGATSTSTSASGAAGSSAAAQKPAAPKAAASAANPRKASGSLETGERHDDADTGAPSFAQTGDKKAVEQAALQENRSYEVIGGSSASPFSARQAEPQTVAAASTGSTSSSTSSSSAPASSVASATTTGSSARSASASGATSTSTSASGAGSSAQSAPSAASMTSSSAAAQKPAAPKAAASAANPRKASGSLETGEHQGDAGPGALPSAQTGDKKAVEQAALQENRSYEVIGGSSASPFAAHQPKPQTVAAASTGSASSSTSSSSAPASSVASATTTGSSARSASASGATSTSTSASGAGSSAQSDPSAASMSSSSAAAQKPAAPKATNPRKASGSFETGERQGDAGPGALPSAQTGDKKAVEQAALQENRSYEVIGGNSASPFAAHQPKPQAVAAASTGSTSSSTSSSSAPASNVASATTTGSSARSASASGAKSMSTSAAGGSVEAPPSVASMTNSAAAQKPATSKAVSATNPRKASGSFETGEHQGDAGPGALPAAQTGHKKAVEQAALQENRSYEVIGGSSASPFAAHQPKPQAVAAASTGSASSSTSSSSAPASNVASATTTGSSARSASASGAKSMSTSAAGGSVEAPPSVASMSSSNNAAAQKPATAKAVSATNPRKASGSFETGEHQGDAGPGVLPAAQTGHKKAVEQAALQENRSYEVIGGGSASPFAALPPEPSAAIGSTQAPPSAASMTSNAAAQKPATAKAVSATNPRKASGSFETGEHQGDAGPGALPSAQIGDKKAAEQAALQENRSYEVIGGGSASPFAALPPEPSAAIGSTQAPPSAASMTSGSATQEPAATKAVSATNPREDAERISDTSASTTQQNIHIHHETVIEDDEEGMLSSNPTDHKTLSALTPEQITLLSPMEFQKLIQTTQWNDLDAEQTKAIEEDELLCAIAEEMLGPKPVKREEAGAMAKPAPEMTLPKSPGLSDLGPEHIELLSSEEFRTLFEATRWSTLRHEQLEAIERNTVFRTIASEVLDKAARARASRNGEPKSLKDLSPEQISVLSPVAFIRMLETTRWNELNEKQRAVIESNEELRALVAELMEKVAEQERSMEDTVMAPEPVSLELPGESKENSDESWEFLASVKSLNELSPEQISLLLPIEFIPLLEETRWNELSAEQIAAIEADEDLCEIANEMLQMDAELQPAGAIAGSFPAEEEDDDGFSALSPRMNGNGKAKTS